MFGVVAVYTRRVTEPAPVSPRAWTRWLRGNVGPALVLLLAALLPYQGTWAYDFVNHDDGATIINFPLIREFSPAAIARLFRPDRYPGLPEYMPVKNVSYALDYALFGLKPAGYHLQQQFWYALAVLLLFAWLRSVLRAMAAGGRLGLHAASADIVAFVTALAFALHPVHVESVTWLSGRKDVLSGAFGLAALWCAGRYRRPGDSPRRPMLAAALACLALALLSKPMSVVLPALMLLQDHLSEPEPRRTLMRVLRDRIALYLPACVMTALFIAVYLRVVPPGAHLNPDRQLQLFQGPDYLRWGQQLNAYLEISVAPTRLSPILPPDLLAPTLDSARALFGLACLGLVLALGFLSLRARHPLALALGLFVVPLLPILAQPPWAQYVAARYLFLAVGGPLLALSWCATWALERRPTLRAAAWPLSVLLMLALALNTLRYNATWRDTLSLWLGALENYPRFTLLHKHAGRAALVARQPEQAIGIYLDCLEVDPDYAPCNAALGSLLLPVDPTRAETLLRKALPRDDDGDAHKVLSSFMVTRGRAREGLQLYRDWLAGRPATADQVQHVVRLALAAGDREQAFQLAKEAVRAAAQNHPAAAPPGNLLRDVARLRADPTFTERLERALQRCPRVDCLQQTLGW